LTACVALYATYDAIEHGSAAQHINIRHQDAMPRHRADDLVDHLHDIRCPWIGWIENANSVRQLLDGDRAMIAEARSHQLFDAIRRPPLHTIYVDTRIEQERLTADLGVIDKGQLCVRPSG